MPQSLLVGGNPAANDDPLSQLPLQLLDGATQEDPVDYCIKWDLTQPDNRYVRFTAKRDTDQDWVLLREWKPSSPEVAAYWNEPMRALISFW